MTNLINMPLPSLSDSLGAYIRAVNSIPSLDEKEERRLANAYRRKNDLTAAHQLALTHLRLVVAASHQYAGYGLERSDLIQEGNIGLLKAVKKFDPTRGARLATFALYWIRAEINSFILRNWRIIKIATTKAQRKLFFNMRHLFQKDDRGRLQDAADVAAQLGVSASDVSEMRARLHDTNTVVLEADEDSVGAELTLQADADSNDPERLLLAQKSAEEEHTNLAAALASLDKRSRYIVQARHLRDRAETLHTLAARFGVSAERVRQLEAQALKKLRLSMRPA
ncbi:MAG: RNA polymerase factor sigma-32 [Gammaproteobacteria bacterium]